MPIINLEDSTWGLKPDSQADAELNTVAIKKAVAAAGYSGEIRCPPWLLYIQPDTLNFTNVRFSGAHSSTGKQTVFRAAVEGKALICIAGNAGTIEHLRLDCARIVDAGISTNHSYPALSDVGVENARVWAFDLYDSPGNYERLYAFNSARGFRVRGSNGSTFTACTASNNDGQGWEIGNGVYMRPDPDHPGKTTPLALSGECALYNCSADANLQASPLPADATGQIVFDGVEGGSWWGGYIEGKGPAIHLKGNAHNWTLAQMHCVGGPFRIEQAAGISFLCCAMGAPPANTPHAIVDVTPGSDGAPRSVDIRFVDCYQMRVTRAPWKVQFVSGADSWTAQALGSEYMTLDDRPPPEKFGSWRVGERVWNGQASTASRALGWVNTNISTPHWLPIGHAQPLPATAPAGNGTGAFYVDDSDAWMVPGGQRHSLLGGYDGKKVTLVSSGSGDVDLLSMGLLGNGQHGNIQLSGVDTNGHLKLKPGGTLTLTRITLPAWPDGLQPLTRWREIARS